MNAFFRGRTARFSALSTRLCKQVVGVGPLFMPRCDRIPVMLNLLSTTNLFFAACSVRKWLRGLALSKEIKRYLRRVVADYGGRSCVEEHTPTSRNIQILACRRATLRAAKRSRDSRCGRQCTNRRLLPKNCLSKDECLGPRLCPRAEPENW